MFNGQFFTLGNVRYVPNLKRNLISVGMLDNANHERKISKGMMCITSGCLVKMKAKLEGGVYILQGSVASHQASTMVSKRYAS